MHRQRCPDATRSRPVQYGARPVRESRCTASAVARWVATVWPDVWLSAVLYSSYPDSVPNRRASQSKNRVRRLENSGFRGHRQPVLVAHMVALMGTLGQRGRARKVGDASGGWIDFVGGIEAGGHALVGSVAQQPLFLRGRRGRFRTRR
jgi:hypothetical protein